MNTFSLIVLAYIFNLLITGTFAFVMWLCSAPEWMIWTAAFCGSIYGWHITARDIKRSLES